MIAVLRLTHALMHCRWLACAALAVNHGAAYGAESATPPRAAVSDAPAPGVVRGRLDPHQYDGYSISLVFYDLYGGTGDAGKDRELRDRVEALVQPLAAGAFNAPLAERALADIRALDNVRDASYAIYASERPGQVVLVISATLVADAAPDKQGVLTSGRFADLPVMFESESALLRVQLNSGVGAYLDDNPWFGSAETYTSASPIALDPPGAGTTTWAEGWLEYGLAGGLRLSDASTYAFAEVTGLTSGSTGQDLFRSDTRSKTLMEKAYAGVLWADPQTKRAARASVGRQNWQLDNGFLFSRFSAGANAGPNASLYLNPRTTYEQTVLVDLRLGDFRLKYFDVDPAELEDFDSGTRFQGANISWVVKDAWDLGATAYRIPESKTVFRTPHGGVVARDGQRTWSLRAGYNAVAGVPGLSVLAEYADQDHSDADVSAEAWYAQIGYTARDVRWRPSLTYRYASFSGDDPDTARREAFDPALSGGLDEWVQGVNFKKVVTNSNLNSHRLRFNVAPSERLSFTLDYFSLWADEATPGARRYGDEIDLGVRWSVSRSLFLLGVAGIAWPDDAIRLQTQGAARTWATAQVSLFWGFL